MYTLPSKLSAKVNFNPNWNAFSNFEKMKKMQNFFSILNPKFCDKTNFECNYWNLRWKKHTLPPKLSAKLNFNPNQNAFSNFEKVISILNLKFYNKTNF